MSYQYGPDIHDTFHVLYISYQNFMFKQGQTNIAIPLTDYISWCCATASDFIKYIYILKYMLMKNNKNRTIWWNFTADSRIFGYILWVQKLTPATLSCCVQYCIIMECITTVPSVVLLIWDRILNIVSCSGLSLLRCQATFWNHVDFCGQLWWNLQGYQAPWII